MSTAAVRGLGCPQYYWNSHSVASPLKEKRWRVPGNFLKKRRNMLSPAVGCRSNIGQVDRTWVVQWRDGGGFSDMPLLRHTGFARDTMVRRRGIWLAGHYHSDGLVTEMHTELLKHGHLGLHGRAEFRAARSRERGARCALPCTPLPVRDSPDQVRESKMRQWYKHSMHFWLRYSTSYIEDRSREIRSWSNKVALPTTDPDPAS